MREGTALFAAAEGGAPVGHVTSGGFGPVARARRSRWATCHAAHCAPGTAVYGEVRGKRLPATVTALPFRPSTYKR